ncbi:MAG TPA: glycine cleavage system protein GcvH [Phycisphaerales bacterium]|nr:glycine cleavage system protein GcvH [Phycisphaerales bacterium]
MAIPTDRLYSDSHEWHKVEGDTLTLGLTRFAVEQLTDITYAQMKPVGTRFKAGDAVAEVESVKATSDVYCAAAGEITEINSAVAEDPSLLNSDPYGAWLIRARITDKTGLAGLMDAAGYQQQNGS